MENLVLLRWGVHKLFSVWNTYKKLYNINSKIYHKSQCDIQTYSMKYFVVNKYLMLAIDVDFFPKVREYLFLWDVVDSVSTMCSYVYNYIIIVHSILWVRVFFFWEFCTLSECILKLYAETSDVNIGKYSR